MWSIFHTYIFFSSFYFLEKAINNVVHGVLLRDFYDNLMDEELGSQGLKIKLTSGILSQRTVFSLTKSVILGSSNEGVELTIGHNVPG